MLALLIFHFSSDDLMLIRFWTSSIKCMESSLVLMFLAQIKAKYQLDLLM